MKYQTMFHLTSFTDHWWYAHHPFRNSLLLFPCTAIHILCLVAFDVCICWFPQINDQRKINVLIGNDHLEPWCHSISFKGNINEFRIGNFELCHIGKRNREIGESWVFGSGLMEWIWLRIKVTSFNNCIYYLTRSLIHRSSLNALTANNISKSLWFSKSVLSIDVLLIQRNFM